MYAIVYKNKVIVGPKDWHQPFFINALKRVGVKNPVLPRAPFANFPHKIDDDIIVHKATVIQENFERKTQYLRGPMFVITDEGVTATYQVVDTEIVFARNNFKEQASQERRKKEQSGTTVTIQGVELSVTTEKFKRDEFAKKAAIMSDTDSVNWKFKDKWLTVSKAELLVISKQIETHVQAAFDWEKSISDKIDAAETAEQLLAIEIVAEQLFQNKEPLAS